MVVDGLYIYIVVELVIIVFGTISVFPEVLGPPDKV